MLPLILLINLKVLGVQFKQSSSMVLASRFPKINIFHLPLLASSNKWYSSFLLYFLATKKIHIILFSKPFFLFGVKYLHFPSFIPFLPLYAFWNLIKMPCSFFIGFRSMSTVLHTQYKVNLQNKKQVSKCIRELFYLNSIWKRSANNKLCMSAAQ